MKALSRVPIFSYTTFSSTLLIPTKSLEIKFRKKYLNTETLNELESILLWAAAHSEVQSLFITSFGEEFIQGLDPQEIRELSEEDCQKLFQKLNAITQSFQCLPQTVVIDMKKGTQGVGLELSLAADIRVAKSEAVFNFNHLSQGLIPACGLFSFLRHSLNQSVLRALLLSGTEFYKESFMALGGHCEFDQDANAILTRIFNQAPIARIQTKLALMGIHQNHHKEEELVEKKIVHTVLNSKDYTKEGNFMSAAEFKEIHAQ